MASWRPLLTGQDRQRALTAVQAIAAELRTLLSPQQTTEPAWNLAGAALCLTYLAQATGDSGDAAAAQALLEAATDRAAAAEQLPMSLQGGAAGLAWVLHHIAGRLGLDGAAVATSSLDDELLERLDGAADLGEPYDLLDGLIGLGVYGFECGNRSLVERVIQRLAARRQAAADGLAWHIPPGGGEGAWFAEGHSNLGLAHGVAGLVAFVASAVMAGIEPDTTRPLLLEASQWLRQQRLPDGGARAFPWAVAPGRPPVTQGLDPGWAYADAGIAAALALAARALGLAHLLEEAVLVAEGEAARMDELPVSQPGISHGPAGFAQIFARLYQQTGRPAFRRAARQEALRLLAMQASESVGGFLTHDRAGGHQRADVSFFRGTSGIGLVLLGFATAVDPLWDRVLLLSPLRLDRRSSSAPH